MRACPSLAVWVAVGGGVWGGWVALFARGVVREMIAVVRKQPTPLATA